MAGSSPMALPCRFTGSTAGSQSLAYPMKVARAVATLAAELNAHALGEEDEEYEPLE